MMTQHDALRGQFRLGRILTVYPDSKGIVRDADIATCAGGWLKEEEFFTSYDSYQKRREKAGGPSPGGGPKSST